ncbi:conserved hypothetical protein [Ricinus communis]|uniref:Uncharacterized protein n=1 Tax=Ricinus communis TaxID=3988 RepID=B9S9B3_RICCO|nr:conserved hypothetical protein [Ricinus communis]
MAPSRRRGANKIAAATDHYQCKQAIDGAAWLTVSNSLARVASGTDAPGLCVAEKGGQLVEEVHLNFSHREKGESK